MDFDKAITEIAREFSIGNLLIRKENEINILYGFASSKYKMFKLEINQLATVILELISEGLCKKDLLNCMRDAGLSLEESENNLERIISIAKYDRTDSNAIKLATSSNNFVAPLNVTWDITNVCNLQCSHCFNSSGPVLDDSLSVDECLMVIDELARLKVVDVWLGGGEPLMKKGIDVILRRMKEKGLRVILATNGTLLTRGDYLDLVIETCTEVNISLDGSTPEDHSFLRGPSSKLSDSTEAIRLLKQHSSDIYVTALTVVHTQNIDKVGSIIDFAYSLGCDKWTHDELYEMGRGTALGRFVLSHHHYDLLYDVVTSKATEYRGKMHVEDYVRMHDYVEPGQAAPFYGCVAGTQELSIQPDGSVYPCQKLQYSKYYCGSVPEESIEDIWNTHPTLKWLRNRDVNQTDCVGCGAHATGTCNGGCLAEKEAVFRRHDARDPLCPENKGFYEAHLRQGKTFDLIPAVEIMEA